MEEHYIDNIKKVFENYKQLGERTFAQLEEQDFFWQFNEESNSLAVIINHLSGNMKSRWTDFLTSDGEKTWRNRDAEFEAAIQSKAALIDKWEAGWTCLFTALHSINKNNFNTTIYIRNEPHTIVEAINRQLAHYASHIGQIMYIGRMIKGSDWKSLSIPKGQSTAFNKEMFSKGEDKENLM